MLRQQALLHRRQLKQLITNQQYDIASPPSPRPAALAALHIDILLLLPWLLDLLVLCCGRCEWGGWFFVVREDVRREQEQREPLSLPKFGAVILREWTSRQISLCPSSPSLSSLSSIFFSSSPQSTISSTLAALRLVVTLIVFTALSVLSTALLNLRGSVPVIFATTHRTFVLCSLEKQHDNRGNRSNR